MHRRLETGPSKLSAQISARPTQDVLLALCIPQRIVYLNLLFSVQGRYHKPGTIDKKLSYSRFFTNFLRFLAYFLFFSSTFLLYWHTYIFSSDINLMFGGSKRM